MRSPAVRKWDLFIDESGDFADVQDPVVASGVVVRRDHPLADPALLGDALRRALPGLPWPLHAADLNLPTGLALAHHAGRLGMEDWAAPGQDARALAARAGRAVRILREREPGLVDEAVEALRRGQWSPYEGRRALDDALRREDRAGWESLLDLLQQGRARLRALIEAHAWEGGPGAGVIAALVAGSESSVGDAAPVGVGPPLVTDSERYFAIVRCLIERGGEVLGRTGRHEVRVFLSSRTVVDPSVGRPATLHVRHLGSLVTEWNARYRGAVRFVPYDVSSYGGEAHPGYVLADLAANSARFVLRRGRHGLGDAEAGITGKLGLPVRSGQPPLSHLAATGWARSHIAAVRAGRPGVAPPPGARRWAVEQAEEWAKVESLSQQGAAGRE